MISSIGIRKGVLHLFRADAVQCGRRQVKNCSHHQSSLLRIRQQRFLSVNSDKAEWGLAMNVSEPVDSRRLYRYLRLQSFEEVEMQTTFKEIVASAPTADDSRTEGPHNSITKENMESYLVKVLEEIEADNDLASKYDQEETFSRRKDYASIEAERCWNYFEGSVGKTSQFSEEEFVKMMRDSAASLDVKKILPLTLSMVLVGVSVGVVTPAMPFVVQNLGLTAGEYGLVVSAFALAKMTGNIPSAVLVERYGRKVRMRISPIIRRPLAHRLTEILKMARVHSHTWCIQWLWLLLVSVVLVWQLALSTFTCVVFLPAWEYPV
jgi:hypothetical protein